MLRVMLNFLEAAPFFGVLFKQTKKSIELWILNNPDWIGIAQMKFIISEKKLCHQPFQPDFLGILTFPQRESH